MVYGQMQERIISSDGDVMKSFSTYDGMAVELLRKAGIPVIIIISGNTQK